MLTLFLVTITLGSALLFLVQPMAARFVLPLLGGAPAVWTTCMLFFQAGLLAGYAYTHLLPRWLGNRGHALLHILLLFLGLWFLPLSIPRESVPPAWPAWWLLGALTSTIGLPYLLVAANAPLLQRWFALEHPGRDPYFLYAASNLGSFAGLLAYPFLLEPALTLSRQADVWLWAYLPLAGLTTLCGLPLLVRKPIAVTPDAQPQGPVPYPDAWQKTRWVLLALVPSSLMLSVTHYLTADIAPLPLFWVVPLSIYLLTFVLAFSGGNWFPQRVLVRITPIAVIAVVLTLLREANEPILVVLGLHLATFTLLALLCHGELARTRPHPLHLTGFYLWLAVGGVLGGVLNGLIAPRLFPGLFEYPLMLVLAMLLRPRPEEIDADRVPPPWKTAERADLVFPAVVALGTVGLMFALRTVDLEEEVKFAILFVPPLLVSYTMHERPVRLALAVAAILIIGHWHPSAQGRLVHQQRSFFGIHRVMEKEHRRYLFHGNTVHGSQNLLPTRRHEPLTYYSREGPAGRFFAGLQEDSRLNEVGLVGLGTGSLASYARPGQRWTFFEIDPAVIDIADTRKLFTFLADARRKGADVPVILGDARLSLRSFPQKLGVLVLDAFGSDSIPIHLLTKEAFLEYRTRLRDDGFILMNISNRYLDLEPILANLAKELGWRCVVWHDTSANAKGQAEGKTPSVWALLWDPQHQGERPKAVMGPWQPAIPQPDLPVWRDDYANLLPVIRW